MCVVSSEMHKWLQLPATPTDDPLATVYPVSHHYKKSHVYAVTRINPIYVDDESNRHNGTWNKSGSSGYDSQPHSDHSSVQDKRSPPSDRSSSAGSSNAAHRNATTVPWLLSPIKEGVIDAHQFCIPRPVWPGRDDPAHRRRRGGDEPSAYAVTTTAAGQPERIPRAKCCGHHCARYRCRDHSASTSTASGDSDKTAGARTYSGYASSAYGGTISTSDTGTCSDEAVPSSGTASVKSNRSSSALAPLRPRFDDANKTFVAVVDKTTTLSSVPPLAANNNNNNNNNNWNSVDLRLNEKTDNLHYDCGAMLRGLQFTLDAQQAEMLMQKIKVGKKHRCWCRLVTACLGLIMFLVSVVTVSLALTRGQKMFGSL